MQVDQPSNPRPHLEESEVLRAFHQAEEWDVPPPRVLLVSPLARISEHVLGFAAALGITVRRVAMQPLREVGYEPNQRN